MESGSVALSPTGMCLLIQNRVLGALTGPFYSDRMDWDGRAAAPPATKPAPSLLRIELLCLVPSNQGLTPGTAPPNGAVIVKNLYTPSLAEDGGIAEDTGTGDHAKMIIGSTTDPAIFE